MTKTTLTVACLIVLVLLAGCAPSYLNHTPGVKPPEGYVLVISRGDLKPQWEMAEKVRPRTFSMYAFDSADAPIKKGTSLPRLPNARKLNMGYEDFTFTYMPAGTHYLRYGYIVLGATTAGYEAKTMAPIMFLRTVLTYGDIKIEVPKNAKAVYVGTFLYENDGEYSTKVIVKDEYKKALKALSKAEIPGVGTKDVKKLLGKVIKQYP